MSTTSTEYDKLRGLAGKSPDYADPYGADVAAAWDRARSQEPDTGAYADVPGALLDRALGQGGYESPYAGGIAAALGRVTGRGAYRDPYADEIAAALGRLTERGGYDSPYADAAAALLDGLRDTRFDYDPESDPLYQASRRSYLREADRTASDVLAKTSAATGGRASSYAVTAASQAANAFKSRLTERQQALYDAAYQRYYKDYVNKLGLAEAYAGLDEQALDRRNAENEQARGALEALRELRGDDYSRWTDQGEQDRAALAELRAQEDRGRAQWEQEWSLLLDKLGLARQADETEHARRVEEREALWRELEEALKLQEGDYDRWSNDYALLTDRYEALNDASGGSTERYDRLLTLITVTGYDPSDEELTLAGMSRAEAETWQMVFENPWSYYNKGRWLGL